jgi:CheY-like chemotaxis protein
MVREFAARALSLHGWRVATAPDGQEAVRLYRQARAEGRPFDVVITDLTVPGAMGGLETAAVLRQEDPGARLVVMSGYCDDPVLAHHARHGFCGVVPKPFTVEAIRAAVEAALAPCPGEVRG